MNTSSPSNFSVEDYNYNMNVIETMNNISSNDTIVSKELNIDTINFANKILNFHRIENNTNNSVYNEQKSLEEFDKVISSFGNQNDKYNSFSHNVDLNYNILDLDNLEYITYKSKISTASKPKFDGGDIQYFLYEHNYCMIKGTAPTCKETLDTSKLTNFYKTEENIYIGNPYFNGIDVGELDESPQFCDTESNLQENVQSDNFEIIPNYFSTDNISIYTISDDEQRNDDIEVPELDVISISSASSIEDRSDVKNNSDFNSCGYHSSDFEFIEEHEAKKVGLIINYNPRTTKNEKVKTIEIEKEYNTRKVIVDYFNVPAVSNNIVSKIPQDTTIYINKCSMNVEYQDLGFNMNLYSREKVDKRVQDEANESENKILFMYPSENKRICKRRRN